MAFGNFTHRKIPASPDAGCGWSCGSYFLFSSYLSLNSLSELKAYSHKSDPLRQTSYNWFVTLRESQGHFSQICIFLNTDFGRSGTGRDFGIKKLLRSKNRIELLTPPAVLRFLFSWFTFCISVSYLARKLAQRSEQKTVSDSTFSSDMESPFWQGQRLLQRHS